jgi:Zn-dependent protease
VGAVLLGLLAATQGAPPSGLGAFAALNLAFFLQINIFLALFNLLPIPPFDGSHIVEGLLPRAAARQYARVRPVGLVLIIVLLVVLPWLVPGLNIIQRFVLPPVMWVLQHYYALAAAVAASV